VTLRLRRWLRIGSFVAAAFLSLLIVGLITTQTAWFRDWLRRYVIAEADQYLNGHLAIQRLDGNLFTGVEIGGVSLTQNGETILAARNVGLRYSLLHLIFRGISIDEIRIDEPRIALRRTASGWNVAGLVKEQAQEADREGPARPFRVGVVGISNGTVTIVDAAAAGGLSPFPQRIERVDLQGAFAYEPVHFRIEVGHLSLRAAEPALALNSLAGVITVGGDDVAVERLAVRTAESSLSLRGTVEDYLGRPRLDVAISADKLTPRELGGFVPALATVRVQPAFELIARGPLDALATELRVRSDAGTLDAKLVADAEGADRALRGEATVGELDLNGVDANLPASRVNGTTTVDVQLDAANRIDGRAEVRLGRTTVAGYRVDALDARGRFAGDRARVDARASAYGARATAAGTIVVPGEGRALAGTLDGRVANLDLRRLPRTLGVPALATQVAGRYHAALDRRGPSGEVVFDTSTIEGATIVAGTRVSGALYGDRPSFAAAGEVRDLDLPRLGAALDQPALSDPRLAGRVDATFDVAGRGRTITTVDAAGRIGVPRASLATGELRDVVAEGRLAAGAFDGTLRGDVAGLDPGLASSRPELAGAVTAHLDAAFATPDVRAIALPAATGRLALTLAPSQIGGETIDRGTASATLERGVLTVESLEVAGPLAEVSMSGPVALTDEGESALRYRASVPDLVPVARLAGQAGVSGAARVDGTVTGNRAGLRTQGTLALSNAAYGTTARVTDADGRFDVTLPDLDPARVQAAAHVGAALVEAAGRSIREVTGDVGYAARAVTFDARVEETADRALTAAGTLRLPEPSGLDLQLDRLSATAGDVTWALAAPARIVYGDDRIHVDRLALASGPQRIEATGAIAIGEARAVPADRPLRLTLTAVDLASVDRLAQTGRGLAGTLTGTATASGTLDAPVADAKLTVANGKVGDFTYTNATATIAHDAQGVRVDGRLDKDAQWLTLKGTLAPLPVLRDETRRPTAPLDVRVQSSAIDLGVVQAFTTALKEVAGTANADVHLAGTLGTPVLDGAVQVTGGAFTLAAEDSRFTGLEADLGFQQDRLTVRRFTIADRQGHTLTASGGADVSIAGRSIGNVDVKLSGRDFRVLDGRYGRLTADLDLGVSGAPSALRAEGTIGVTSGRIEVDRVLEEIRQPAPVVETAAAPVASAEPAAPGRPAVTRVTPAPVGGAPLPEASKALEPAASPSMLDALAVDVRVDVPDTLILRGDDVKMGGRGLSLGDLNMTLGGDLHATKAAGGRPFVIGTIHTVRGFYEFQGRRFDLQRDGTVSFKGPDPANPVLDVRATRDISGVEARVRVHGEAQRPELELSSAPPLDEADILSLIIFNRPINDLGEGEKTTLAQRAGSLVGGFVAAPVAEALRDALDVDLLEITPVADDGGASVSIGNQIGEKVFVKVRQQFGSSETTQLVLEYELSRLLRLETAVAQGGDTNRTVGRRTERGGADLVFVIKY
jgi:autotransporter translocation and assembly factor TamB